MDLEDIFLSEFPYKLAYGLLLYKAIYSLGKYKINEIKNKKEELRERIKNNLIEEYIKLEKAKTLKAKEKLLISWGNKINLNFETAIEDSKKLDAKGHEKFVNGLLKNVIAPEIEKELNKKQ